MAIAPVDAQPHPRLGVGRLIGINAFWFGGGAHWQPIYISLIPVGATLAAGAQADLLIGRLTAAGGLFALLTPILTGWLSDRTVSRWGRRRPWMVAGTALNIAGLGLLAVAGSPAGLIGAYLLVQLSNNAAGAAYTGVIPDAVPAEDRGRASGLLGTMNQLGTVVGVGLVGLGFTAFGDTRAGLLYGYGVVAAIMAITLLVTLVAVQEPPSLRPARQAPRRSPGDTALLLSGGSFSVALACLLVVLLVPLGAGIWAAIATMALGATTATLAGLRVPTLRDFFSAFRSNDFFWTFLTRALVTLGIFSILPFMELYFADVVGSKKAAAASAFWLLAVIAGAIIPSIVGGVLSDRSGRRKLFVYLSSGLQATVVSVLLFGLVRSISVLYLLGVLYGVGYGAYYAVDWALACDVLPDRKNSAGRDMALWHISFTLPQVLAPALLAGLLHFLNQSGHRVAGIPTGDHLGFRFIFGSAAIWFILGTVMVSRIRGVR